MEGEAPRRGGPSARSYTPDDRADCLAIFDSNVPEYFHEHERAEFDAFLGALPGPYLVLCERGGIVACGGYALGDDGPTADLCWGMVRADLHGQGLGRRLAEARIDAALEDPRVAAIALVTSQHTVGFYEKLGFTLGSVTPDGFAPGLDRCEMRRTRGGS